jgi:D-aminoacyl-tRNA deacylase
MIALLQRAEEASVEVAGEVVGAIDFGVLILLGVLAGDEPVQADRLAEKVAGFRILADGQGRPNQSILDTPGARALVVSQFTLGALTGRGRRADYGPAARAEIAEPLYLRFIEKLRAMGVDVETGVFGTHMRVRSLNDGPVTFWLEVP